MKLDIKEFRGKVRPVKDNELYALHDLEYLKNLNVCMNFLHPHKSTLGHEHEGADEVYVIMDGEGEMDLDGKTQSFRLAEDRIVAQQVIKALDMNMTPILCVGETLQEREDGQTLDVVFSQLKWGLHGLTPKQVMAAIVAYEPVWAIGTGVTASPEEAQEVHAGINDNIFPLVHNIKAGAVTPQQLVLLRQPAVNPLG